MNINKPVTIEDFIYSSLLKGTVSIVKMIESIHLARPKTTKQGVYAVIRKLKKQETVVVHKKNISLSGVWLKSMEDFIDQAMYNTKQITSSGNSFLQLRPGERMQYYFRNPILTDAFWSHVFITLIDESVSEQPVLIYNPHEWFLLARNENEVGLFNRIADRGQKLAILAGNSSTLDKSVRSYLKNPLMMYETLPKNIFIKENYYINVIGNFIIEVWIDQKIQAKIDQFYLNNNKFDTLEKRNLEEILMQKGKNRFSITNNKRKADALRSKFKKYFFL